MKEYDTLNIHFTYKPKILLNNRTAKKIICDGIDRYTTYDSQNEFKNWRKYLPIQNLLTISLEDPNGFRGSAHRQNPDQHIVLSQNDASSGMLPGRIIPGLWTATISAHAVVTTRCKYWIRITGGKAND